LPTRHPLVHRVFAKPGLASSNGDGLSFEDKIEDLIELAGERGDAGTIIGALMNCVPGYRPLTQPPLEKHSTLV